MKVDNSLMFLQINLSTLQVCAPSPCSKGIVTTSYVRLHFYIIFEKKIASFACT
jgi:hypothetical protein